MNIWWQIGSAGLIIMMLIFLYPTAKHWLQNGPKAQAGDWQAAMIPLLLVAGFVMLLIALVR